MRLASAAIGISALWHLTPVVCAQDLDCSKIVADGIRWNLQKLKGPNIMHSFEATPDKIRNHTFIMNICRPMLPKKFGNCPQGSRVCAMRSHTDQDSKKPGQVEDTWAIAGNFVQQGRHLEPKFQRLKNSDSHADADKEGLRITMSGGIHFDVKQKAVLELICDKDKSGLEGRPGNSKRDNDGVKLPNPDKGKPLQVLSYKTESEKDIPFGVLRLEWRSKFACEDAADKVDEETARSGRWGFFTWFIIVLFLAIAAYLIFGSWLNYNRYGARGWDLLPHGDTIRDVPYLLKDWGRRVVGTFQGGGSRDIGYIRV